MTRALRAADIVGAWTLLMGDWVLTVLGLAGRSLAAAPQCLHGPMQAEFTRMLRMALPGCLRAATIVAVLVGATLVAQGLYWIEFTGQRNLLETLLVDVLTRQLAPVLAVLVLLLRVGTQNLVELGAIRGGPAWRGLHSRGLNPWILFAAPRALAAGLAGATLAVLIVAVAGVGGHVYASLSGSSTFAPGVLMDAFLRGMTLADYLLLSVKSALMAFLAMLATALVAMGSRTMAQDPARLMPRGVAAGAGAALAGALLVGLVGALLP
jgi:ABC-type transporter Mla maintaining outer membrane lipid asymmetry permease subunit MlaE